MTTLGYIEADRKVSFASAVDGFRIQGFVWKHPSPKGVVVIAHGAAERGLLVCSSGVGMSIAANKVRGVRAALGTNEEEVRLTREHNDANVLALGAKFIDPDSAEKLIKVFLSTDFQGGRHARRVEKIALLERND
jgi:ribose 5-phosphate isomerase B